MQQIWVILSLLQKDVWVLATADVLRGGVEEACPVFHTEQAAFEYIEWLKTTMDPPKIELRPVPMWLA